MITRWTSRFRRLRRWFSRSEWDVRLLGLPRSQGTESSPGLVMIQIDGLARRQLERAILKGRMPFVRKLIKREGYRLHDFYSGQPASTPAVQGELFWGQKCAVPSFDFYDRETGELHRMFSYNSAVEVENRLRAAGEEGLLSGGSVYSDIYSGGAEEVHFCAVNSGLPSKRRAVAPLRRLGFALWHCMSAVRIAALVLIELCVAIFDLFTGQIKFRELNHELWSILSRVLVSVGLRELATIGALMDIARGLPVIHLNYLGYDEQAHRRGPSSAFAHWALRGVDNAIRQLWSAAHRSSNRDYEVWIYADHGQEHDIPYEYDQGRPIHEAVAEVLHKHLGRTLTKSSPTRKQRADRSSWLGGGWLTKLVTGELFTRKSDDEQPPLEDSAYVASAGPVGHIYLRHAVTPEQLDKVARALVHEAGIPLVFRREGQDTARAYTAKGEFNFPDQAAEVLGAEHPFLPDVSVDLTKLCHHEKAGDLVICGFRLDQKLPVSFPIENGSHAGPGYYETHAFALLPSDAPLPRLERPYLRPLDLRHAALHRLGRRRLKEVHRFRQRSREVETIRVMTYNVHSCVGMDGKLSPARIARVIEQCDADVIALQELDVRRKRSGEIDQAHVIAKLVEMDHHFHPVIRLAEEQFGDAVLSHLPMNLVRCGALPRLNDPPALEPRGAIWVELLLNGHPIQLINTHLGLKPPERLMQIEELLGPNWLAHPDCERPLILCGDLNANPFSKSYRLLASKLRDAQCGLNGHRPRATFFSNAPFNRIDHVFVSPGVQVQKIEVLRNNLTRVASDHLPLVVTLAIDREAILAANNLNTEPAEKSLANESR